MVAIDTILYVVGFILVIGSLFMYALRTKDWSIFKKLNAEDSEMTKIEKIINNGGLLLIILGFVLMVSTALNSEFN